MKQRWKPQPTVHGYQFGPIAVQTKSQIMARLYSKAFDAYLSFREHWV